MGSWMPANHMKLYEEKINQRRFEEIEPLISKEAVFWSGAGTYSGIDAIREAFEASWEHVRNETYRIDTLNWVAIDETVATCTYRFGWRADIGAMAFEGNGRGTAILHKEEGGWKIVHEHLANSATQLRGPAAPAAARCEIPR